MYKTKKTILVVEDDPVTSLSEKVMLESNGYRVLTALSGRKAIETASKSQVDLILMDIELGGNMDGHSAAKKILEKKNIPIVFLTAHIEKEMVEKVKSITRYGYLLKNSGDYVLLSSIEMVFELFEAHEKTRISEENYRKLVEDINDIIFLIDTDGFFTYISPRVEFVSGYRVEEIINRHFSEFTYDDDVKKVKKLLSSLDREKEYKSEFRKIRKNGEIAWINASLRPVFTNGVFAGATGILSDITERKESEEKVKALLTEKGNLLKELKCLYNISRIAEENAYSVEAMIDGSIHEIPLGFLFAEKITVRININGKIYIDGKATLYSDSIKNNIIVNNVIYGNIESFYREGYSFTEREKQFLETVAERIGRIIELTVAKNELRELEKEIISISEDERQKIGREIHDSLGQILTGISFLLKAVSNNGGYVTPEKINEISGLVYDATMICRKITKGLPMKSVGHDNLVLAIDQLAINVRNLYQLNCEFDFNGEITVKDDFTSSQLYYIVQEAVNNAAKHSCACNIKIRIIKENDLIRLTIHDDGKGKIEDDTGGLGLSIMKYRSDLIGGIFRAENHYERGFFVSVDVPVLKIREKGEYLEDRNSR